MILILRSYFTKICSLLFFAVTFFVGENTFAQSNFSVQCPTKVGKNDIFQIQFKVDNGSSVSNITPPSFKGFVIVGGPNQASSMSNINGKVSQSISVGFSLQPVSLGKFTIGSATAVVDGKTFTTRPVTVQVVKGSTLQPSSQPSNTSPFANFSFDFPEAPRTEQFDDYILKPGENVAQKTKKNLFLKLDCSKTNCYVGEPIVVSYKLYTRLHSETNITDAPSFNGFSVTDLKVNDNSSIEKYDGRQYNVYTLRKVELYPLQSGNITIDPVVADNNVTFIKSEYVNTHSSDMFYNMLGNFGDAVVPSEGLIEQKVTLKTPPLVISVKPLPAKDKPESFKGAVGDFSITSSLAKNEITTDDAGSLVVEVKGEGNLQMVNSPSVKWPEGLEGFDPQLKENINKEEFPMSGTKTFTYPFTVSNPGDYKIDSITFSYFDPASGRYQVLHTPPLEVNVTKGKGIHPGLLAKNNVQKAGADNGFFSQKTEIITGILLLIGLGILIFLLAIRKKKDQLLLEKNIKLDDLKNDGEEKEFLIPENPLLDAHEKLVSQSGSGFYYSLNTSLRKYLAGKFKIPVNELTRKRLNEELDKNNVSLGTSIIITSLLDEIEINLYAPPSDVNQMNATFEKASEVVSLLDKQIGNK